MLDKLVLISELLLGKSLICCCMTEHLKNANTYLAALHGPVWNISDTCLMYCARIQLCAAPTTAWPCQFLKGPYGIGKLWFYDDRTIRLYNCMYQPDANDIMILRHALVMIRYYNAGTMCHHYFMVLWCNHFSTLWYCNITHIAMFRCYNITRL